MTTYLKNECLYQTFESTIGTSETHLPDTTELQLAPSTNLTGHIRHNGSVISDALGTALFRGLRKLLQSCFPEVDRTSHIEIFARTDITRDQSQLSVYNG